SRAGMERMERPTPSRIRPSTALKTAARGGQRSMGARLQLAPRLDDASGQEERARDQALEVEGVLQEDLAAAARLVMVLATRVIEELVIRRADELGEGSQVPDQEQGDDADHGGDDLVLGQA